MQTKRHIFKIENHPFKQFVPANAVSLIIGTFPTHSRNLALNFYYGGNQNLFWPIMESISGVFKYYKGELAVNERKLFLDSNKIGLTDMISLCYRKNNSSTDEDIFPIKYNNIFKILDENNSIKNLIFTSRTEVYGALGHFKTYCLQNDHPFELPIRGHDKILRGNLQYREKEYRVLVPYSPSPRVQGINLNELISMYKTCLNIK